MGLTHQLQDLVAVVPDAGKLFRQREPTMAEFLVENCGWVPSQPGIAYDGSHPRVVVLQIKSLKDMTRICNIEK